MSSKISEGKVKILILLTACLFIGANSFQFGDPIRIMVNKISPFTNPTETYKYYDLPFCQPEKPTKESQSFGEKLTGNRKMNSLYQATFGTNLKKTSICEVELNAEQLSKFRSAIKQNYLFEMFIEDAVAGNSIGYVKNGKVYLATHLNFNIFYNKAKGNIIKAQIDYDELYHVVDITNNAPLSVNFTYAVNWGDTSISSPVSNNGNDTAFVSEPHMLTFFNGITINSLLFVILWRIFQKIQKATDPTSSTLDTEAEKKDGDFNWKAIRGEVFRAPVYKILLCAGVGSGLQLILTALIVLVLGAIGMFYQAKGSLLATTAFIYIGASVVSGIASSSLFRYLGGKTWTANLVATFLCFPAPLTIVATVLNNIAWIDQSTAALPFGTVIMLIILLVIALPLTIVGGVTGRKREKEKLLEADDKSSKAFSDFFSLKPSHLFMVAVAGLFSFSVLYFELHSIFAAVWARKVYTAYGQLLLTVVLTISITASISIIFTYCQLNNRDCKWWWRSFFYGGSCGFYVFLYAIYFYTKKSHISGFMQTCFYFGYSAMGAFAVFLVLGAASFVGASAFVKQIYERRKVD